MFDLLMVVLSLGLILFFNMGDGEKAELGGAIWFGFVRYTGEATETLSCGTTKRNRKRGMWKRREWAAQTHTK